MTASEHAAPAMPQQGRLWPAALLCILLIFVELYALFFDLEGGGRVAIHTTSLPVATLRRGFNEVRSRSAGTITWTVPSSGADFYGKDAVLTMADARAFIEFSDGSLMTIEPDSLVVLERSDSVTAPKIVLHLLEGTLARSTTGHLPITIDLGEVAGGKAASVVEDSSGTALFRMHRERDSVNVEVDDGQLSIESAAGTQTLKSFQNATISPTEVKVAEVPLRFTALAPDDGKTEPRDESDGKIGLSWKLVAPGKPVVSIDSKALISRHSDLSGAREVSSDGNSASFEPEGDGAYFWQLISKDGKTKSGVASFTVITKSRPEVRKPQDDADLLVGQDVVYTWKPLVGARVYLETSAMKDFVSPNRTDAPTGHDWIEAKYDSPRTVYWRLRADYGQGAGISKPTEVRTLVIRARALLKAPKGIKSRIKIETSSRLTEPSGLLARLADLFEASAFAEEVAPPPPPKHLVVELEWQPLEGAKNYRLQISDSEDFSRLLFDRQVDTTTYDYRTVPSTRERTLYFRVAGIDETGTRGEFSDTNAVSIEATRPEPPKRKVVTAPPVEKIIPRRTPPQSAQLSLEDRNRRERFHFLFTAGAAYHSRTFKSTTSPTNVTGSGLVPAFGSVELRRWLGAASDQLGESATTGIAAGVSLLAEKAQPTTAGVTTSTLGIPLLRGWVALEKPLWGAWAGVGPYGTTSQKFSWAGTTPVATRQIALGLTVMLTSSQVEERSWHWRAQAAVLGAGAKGGEGDFYLRHYFGGAVRAVDRSGAFWQGEGMVRYLDIETSYSGILEIGYAL